jgi:hypothetical protein
VGFEAGVARGVELEPGLGVVVVSVLERELGIGRVKREETEEPVGRLLGPGLVDRSVFLARRRRCVVDVS